MPKVSVAVDHHSTPEEVKEKAGPIIEKTIKDFQGHGLEVEWSDMNAQFRFKSLAFTINGTIAIDPRQIVVEVDLPFAALMYKDRVHKGIEKNLTRALGSATE
jgi:hypothetical protein